MAGDLWSLQQELVALADLELRAGQLAAALEAAREALQLADELGSVRARRRSLLALALVEALLGRDIDCREHVQLGLDSHSEGGAFAPEAVGGLALGLLELSLARPAEAIVALESVRRYARQVELQDPGWLPWEAVLIESYLADARPDDARETFDAFEARTRAFGRGPLQAAVARAAGLLADDDAFSARFDQALELLTRDGNPFEVARTRLCYGERLVRVELHEPPGNCCARRSTASSCCAPCRGRSERARRSLRVARLRAAKRRERSICSRPRSCRSCASSPKARGTVTLPRGSS